MPAEPTTDLGRFGNLTDPQADGLACVVCRISFLAPGAPGSTPVGRSVTGSQVFA